jgi:MoxR-like ATPase
MTDTPPLPPTSDPFVPDAVAPEPVGVADDAARAALLALREEVGKAVVGQDSVVTGLVIALLCRGHVLLEGVPGTAKTLMIRALATALDLESTRIQFTPDLMPGDVTGSLVYDSRSAEFSFKPGPVFTNLLLADEINRTPPKTQASLLEAMEERQVTVEGRARPLPDPFVVAATQNPVEYEGTYPLPEAQTDRFLMKVRIGYPEAPEEAEILRRAAAGFDGHDLDGAGVGPVVGAAELTALRTGARALPVAPELVDYVTRLVRGSRQLSRVRLGASPRAGVALLATARARAALRGAGWLSPDDVKAVAAPVLRHRLVLRPEAELEGASPDELVAELLDSVAVPR